MPSPFPGMDPWLEEPAGWGGVHAGLIVAIQAALNLVLPDGLIARIDEYVWVREDDDEAELRKPDVFLPEPTRPGPAATATRVGTAPSVHGRLSASAKKRVRYLQITTARGRQVFTVLEILSPKNKNSGSGREVYTQKRREYLASVNFVELDLLRAGNRFPMGRPAPPEADYYVFSCRRSEYPEYDAWAFTVRDPLPVVPIPVSPDYPDAPLDLRAALDRVYDEGRYGASIDYTAPPTPRLRKADAEWAADWLAKAAPPNPKGG